MTLLGAGDGIDVFELAGFADSITALVVASVAIGGLARARYQKTLGSRKKTAASLRAVTCGNPLPYVENLFGESIYREKEDDTLVFSVEGSERPLEKRLYNARHGWLTVHYLEEIVVAFAFTLTDPRFKFDLEESSRHMFSGTLGRTVFASLNPSGPDNVECFSGPYSVGYTETSEFGRNGLYQKYGLSSTSDGWAQHAESIISLGNLTLGRYATGDAEPPAAALEQLRWYRTASAPDTFAVFGDEFQAYELTELSASGTFDWDSMMRLAADGPVGWRDWSRPSRRRRIASPMRRTGSRLRRTST